ncbi:uncharacterized protein [Clytia hemisphaerica]|uniref:uncharacterized protein n=1 Tax=Clytia hemisphaerica TaxID=252671 RepID=UPI0034D51CA5
MHPVLKSGMSSSKVLVVQLALIPVQRCVKLSLKKKISTELLSKRSLTPTRHAKIENINYQSNQPDCSRVMAVFTSHTKWLQNLSREHRIVTSSFKPIDIILNILNSGVMERLANGTKRNSLSITIGEDLDVQLLEFVVRTHETIALP